MLSWEGKRNIQVVTAYVRPDGCPDFTLTEVSVTQDEYENGIHYDLVEDLLGQAGYEEPFTHFDELDAPPFLLPAVKQYLESLNTSAAI
jgi:hypothetical protein